MALLEAGEGAGALECLAQRIDALGGVLAAILVDAAERVVGKAAKGSAYTASKASATQVQAHRHKVHAKFNRLWRTSET